jgi:hypothetical protein
VEAGITKLTLDAIGKASVLFSPLFSLHSRAARHDTRRTTHDTRTTHTRLKR